MAAAVAEAGADIVVAGTVVDIEAHFVRSRAVEIKFRFK